MIGSNVKVLLDSDIYYGVIRWIGTPPGTSPDKIMAAVELVSEMRRLNENYGLGGKKNKLERCIIHRMTDIL